MTFRIVKMIENNLPERKAYTFAQMIDTGLLWYINRSLLNPRGFALALEYADDEDEPRGWSIVASDGPITLAVDNNSVGWEVPTYDNPITVTIDDGFEKEKFDNLEHMLEYARRMGRVPPEETAKLNDRH